MAKKEHKTHENAFRTIDVQRIHSVNIYEFNKDLMQIYGANVNSARMISHIFDGLKPVERKILYAMYADEGLRPKKGFTKKVAKIIGTVLGKYYPHGDVAAYEVLVRLGQWWVMNPMLIKKQGNYGSIFGQSAAAMRYIEAGMSKFCWDAFFSEWTPNVTDFTATYTGDDYEPEVLPAKYPILLIKGSTGLGYGLYSGIPPFNLGEVMDLCCKLIDNPDMKNVWLYPDFPVKSQIVNKDFKEICEKGEGSFRVRGIIEIDDRGDLIIRSLPYTVTMDTVYDKIIELVKAKKLEGIADIKDESKRGKKNEDEGPTKVNIALRVVLKKGFNPEVIRDAIYKSTPMESSFTVNFEFIYDYVNYHYSLKSAILEWLELRRETKRRIAHFEYAKLKKRYHLLDSIINMLKQGEQKYLKIMKSSKNRSQIIERLIEAFGMTDIQAETIADMHFYQLSEDDIAAFKKERDELKAKVDAVKAKLADDSYIDQEIKNELKECKKTYGMPRQSEIISVSDEKAIPDTKHTIVITKNGFIKKLPFDVDGVGEIEYKDKAIQILKLHNKEELLIFDGAGKVFSLTVNDIAETAMDRPGVLLNTYIKTSDKIITIMQKPSDKDIDDKDTYLVFATKNGLVKKSLFKNYSSVTSSGLISLILKKDDSLVSVIKCKGNKDLIIYTKEGKGVRYNSKEIPDTLRMASGVIGIRLEKDDAVAGMIELKKNDKYLFVITNKGTGKKCLLCNFENMKRPDKGLNIIDLEDEEKIVGMITAKDKDIIEILTSEKSATLALDEVPELTRKSKAKKILSVRKGENIIDIF